MKVLGVIPARYGSTRLPGKPLLDICGHPMLYWVYNRVKRSEKLGDIIVATDHPLICSLCKEYNIPFVLTKSEHRTAANRLWEVSERFSADYYVQINGDEPLINVEAVSAVVPDEVPQETEFGTNIVSEIDNTVDLISPTNIKVVFDYAHRIVYMSRTPIPYPYKGLTCKYFKHIGIIGYNKKMLDFYHTSEPRNLEIIEGIDTLRFIDYGKKLVAIYVKGLNTLSVDTQADLDFIRGKFSEEQY